MDTHRRDFAIYVVHEECTELCCVLLGRDVSRCCGTRIEGRTELDQIESITCDIPLPVLGEGASIGSRPVTVMQRAGGTDSFVFGR